jgi:hypothetical protein
MARPIKNYCDYFPHDRDMRNHRKVKAIRTKFGVIGYAIWSMTLEYLTGIDGNVLEYSDVEFELMAGDFGVSATEIRDVLDYCIKLEMLFLNNGFINSESLDERLVPVYEKRGRSKSNSRKQQRVNGKFVISNTVSDGVSVAEKPQSKVNKSKVKETKPNIEEFLSFCKEDMVKNNMNFNLYEYSLKSKYESWVENGWKDGFNKTILNWKAKIRNTIPHLSQIKPSSQQNGNKYQEEVDLAVNAYKSQIQ